MKAKTFWLNIVALAPPHRHGISYCSDTTKIPWKFSLSVDTLQLIALDIEIRIDYYPSLIGSFSEISEKEVYIRPDTPARLMYVILGILKALHTPMYLESKRTKNIVTVYVY